MTIHIQQYSNFLLPLIVTHSSRRRSRHVLIELHKILHVVFAAQVNRATLVDTGWDNVQYAFVTRGSNASGLRSS